MDQEQDTLKRIPTECSTDDPQKIKGDPEFMASVQEAKTQNNVPAEDTTPESETSLTAENQQIDEIISTEEISV